MRYAAIEDQAREYPVQSLCRLLHVSPSGYYAWRGRPASRRAQENERLVAAMREVHQTIDRAYGSPRMHAELVSQGLSCGRHRVARTTVRFRRLTKAGKREPAAPNILDRQFDVTDPNRVWASDITYIPTAQGHLYLAVVLDLYSRQVVGWAMTSRLGAELVTTALRQALRRRPVEPGLLHHSDRDGLYASAAYKHLLAEHDMISSMSRKGNPYDNAFAESFIKTLKYEEVYLNEYDSFVDALENIGGFIDIVYNKRRLHSSLGYKSPETFEKGVKINKLT